MPINIDIKIIHDYAKKMRSFILDLVLPINCLGCGKEGTWLCYDCLFNLKTKETKKCFSCGQKNKVGNLCELCSPMFYFDNIYIAGDYKDKTLAQLIKIYKYRFAQDISVILADYIYKYLISIVQKNITSSTLSTTNDQINFKNYLFIPVPLHKKRLRWRGFNQAELLAKELIKKLSGELESINLQRIKFHLPQTRLKKDQRKNNVKNVFVWQGPKLNNKNIILVDDIVTTGATLNECARILKENGANKIICLTVAHGL